ncbi:MAG TPA: DUF192 domain-containing protein [Candidatus Paceibacterota bacterium]|jgi:hypothetical protein
MHEHFTRRPLVLYGGLAAVVLLVLVAAAFLMREDVSYTEPPVATSTSQVVATSSRPAPSASVPAEAPKPFRFEVVTSVAAQAKGLGGRADIPADYGMLFIFEAKERRGFWMKDMLAPIDIIWISDESIVVGVEENVSPDSYKKAKPDVFYPPEAVRYVLETRAGEARRLGLAPGVKLNLPLP